MDVFSVRHAARCSVQRTLVSIVIIVCIVGAVPCTAQRSARPRRSVVARRVAAITPSFEVLPQSLTLVVGEQSSIFITPSAVKTDEIEFVTSSDAIKVAPTANKSFVVTALKTGNAFVRLTLGSTRHDVQIVIEPARAARVQLGNIKPEETTMLIKGETRVVRLQAKDKLGENVSPDGLTLESASSAVAISNMTLTGVVVGKTAISVKERTRTLETFEVEVYEPQIVFDNPHPFVREDSVTKVEAFVLDHDGERLKNARVTWEPGDTTSPLQITQSGKATVSLLGRRSTSTVNGEAAVPQQPVEVVARFGSVRQPLYARILKPYKPLTTTLDVLDERTAKDLFGDEVVKEFHVVRVTLVNNSADALVAGMPMLAFTDTMRIGVGLEKRFTGKRNKGMSNSNDGWVPFTPEDYGEAQDAKGKCKHFFTVRPHGHDTMLYTADNRVRRSNKERQVRFLDIFRTTASAVTGVAVPGGGSALIPALEKFSNGVLPGYQKFLNGERPGGFTDSSLGLLLRPMEEVATGREISRYVFIPKRSINGVLEKYEVRVSEVCTHNHDSIEMRYAFLPPANTTLPPKGFAP